MHPLGVLLALLTRVALGGLGGALGSVPLAGVLYVIFLALYSDAAGQTSLLKSEPRPSAYSALRQVRGPRRGALVPVAPVSPPPVVPVPVPNERLATIASEQAALSTQFAAQEATQGATPAAGDPRPPGRAASRPPRHKLRLRTRSTV